MSAPQETAHDLPKMVWLEVDLANKELPMKIADTALELATLCGITESTVVSACSRAKRGGNQGGIMPRTKLDRPTPEQHRKTVNKIIETAMIREEIPSHKELGKRIGLSEMKTSRRFKGGWSVKELFLLYGVLNFTADECVKLIGGR